MPDHTTVFDRQALRWYTLFLGVMKCVLIPSPSTTTTDRSDGPPHNSVLYVVWDIADDKYFMKANDSDASQWAMLYPRIGAHGTSLPAHHNSIDDLRSLIAHHSTIPPPRRISRPDNLFA